MTPRPYPGRKGGYHIRQIAELMGTSHATAKRWVRRFEKEQGHAIHSGEEVGELVWQYRDAVKNGQLEKLLDSELYD